MSIYGCHNKPRPSAETILPVQSGYAWSPSTVTPATGQRVDYMVNIPFVMTSACQYTIMHASDKLCAGCIHQHKD